MSIMLNILQTLFGNRMLNDFKEKCTNPDKIQTLLLKNILIKNKLTVYGEKYNFKDIDTFEDFQKNIPISSYDDLFPYINAGMSGETNQLTRDKTIFYATTSGTTGAVKYIPITKESKKVRSELMLIGQISMMKDHPNLCSNKTLAIISPKHESFSKSNISCGAESGRSYLASPSFVKKLHTLPYDIFKLKDYESKYYCIARIAASQKVSYICTCNPSTILLICKYLKNYTQEIIQDVRDGTLTSRFNFSNEFKESITKKLKPDPQRALFLEKAAKQGNGKLLPEFIWPELDIISCWKGGTLSLYLDKFDQYFSKKTAIREMGYFASEFFGSIPVSDNSSEGVLAIPYNVYEFYPVDSGVAPSGKDLLKVNEIEMGIRYFIYITTVSGLYRYDMNDIIEVTGFYEQTPLIKFIQKRNGITSLTGEKISEYQVIIAVEKALVSRKGYYDFIVAIGETDGESSKYYFLIEFDQNPSDEEARSFINDIDTNLQLNNSEYASKRKSLRLNHPILRVIRNGEFYKYRKRMVEKGQSDSVFKTMRVTTDMSYSKEFEIYKDHVVTI